MSSDFHSILEGLWKGLLYLGKTCLSKHFQVLPLNTDFCKTSAQDFMIPCRSIKCVSSTQKKRKKKKKKKKRERSYSPEANSTLGFHKHYSYLWGALPQHFAASFTVQWQSWFPQRSTLLKKEPYDIVALAWRHFLLSDTLSNSHSSQTRHRPCTSEQKASGCSNSEHLETLA